VPRAVGQKARNNMKREFLQEVIKNIVAHKLSEINAKGGKYGYVIANKDTDNPTLQMVGYGNMPASAWKNKIINELKDLLSKVEADDWRNAKHALEPNGVLHSSINMMAEIFAEDLNEIDQTQTAADTAAAKKLEDAQKKLAAAQEKERKALEDKRKIDKSKADFDRRNYPVVNRTERAITKANIAVGKASTAAAEEEENVADIAKKIGK